MTVIDNNLRALREKQPELARKLEQSNNTGILARILPTKDGNKTLEVISDKGQKLLLHSKYSPIKEAGRLVDSYEIEPTSNLAILGLGLGYHLMDILQRPADRDFILAVEKDLDTFRAFLATHDVSKHVLSGKVIFAVSEEPQDIFRRLQFHTFTILENCIKAVKHPPSVKMHPGYYDGILKAISEMVIWGKVNTNTQIESGRKYVSNTFENIPQLLTNSGVIALKNIFPDKPAVIVSAGPSLTKNVSQLRIAQGKAVIICVDTSLRVLLAHGIRPDLVVSIDLTANNKRYFERIDTKDLTLVADLEVFPGILREFKGRKLIINLPGKSVCEWFSSVLGDFGTIEKGLSVAHTAFLLALYIGCRKIAFIGQDLAYSEGFSHARGTSMSRKEIIREGKENYVPILDIFGGRILTHVSMHVFLKHFEEIIHKYKREKTLTCIDATEGGARIHGTEVTPLKEFICRYCDEVFSPSQKISATVEAYKRIMAKDLLDMSENIAVKLEKAADICKKGKLLMQRIEKRSSNGSSSSDVMKQLHRDFGKISASLSEYTEEIRTLKDIVVEEMVLQTKKMPINADREAMRDYVCRTARCYGGFANACLFLTGKFKGLAEAIRIEQSERMVFLKQ